MLTLEYDFCEECQIPHAFFEIGSGHRNYPSEEWDYDVLYESLED